MQCLGTWCPQSGNYRPQMRQQRSACTRCVSSSDGWCRAYAEALDAPVGGSLDVVERDYQQVQMHTCDVDVLDVEDTQTKDEILCLEKGLVLDPTEDYDDDDFHLDEEVGNVGNFGIRGHSSLLPSDGKYILKAQRLGCGVCDASSDQTVPLRNTEIMYKLMLASHLAN